MILGYLHPFPPLLLQRPHARVILVCVDKADDATRITEVVKAEFPRVPVAAHAIDRRHSIALLQAGADLQVKETFESALVLGASALERLGASQAEIAQIAAQVRATDRKRLELELAGGLDAGRALFNRRMGQADGDGSEA